MQTLGARLRDLAQRHTPEPPAGPAEDAITARQLAVAISRAGWQGLGAGEVSNIAVGGQGESQPANVAMVATIDQQLDSVRRGECPQLTPYEILSPMSSPSPASESDAAEASSQGISAFIARVLDQLTLSAWLPAALLTGSIAILLAFRSDKSANILVAVHKLTTNPLRVLVLIIPLLVITTVVTQAFSFEAIRTLEGYWRRRGFANLARTMMIKRHVRRKDALEKRRIKESEKAFYVAEPRMLRAEIPFPIVNAMKAQALELEDPPLTEAEGVQLDKMNWQSWSDAWRIARIDHLANEEDDYPQAYRVLPTKLGNVIRATEDQLRPTDGDLQGFALRRYGTAPRLVQIAHDQYRNRLEMYCTLVFVSGALCLLTLAILLTSRVGSVSVALIAGGFAALSASSYLAAIASARGYCSALKEMGDGRPSH
jgi:hypothetical protein